MDEELPERAVRGAGHRPCDWCGEPVIQIGMGRRRAYCKRSHRQRAYEARNLQQLLDRIAELEAQLQSQPRS